MRRNYLAGKVEWKYIGQLIQVIDNEKIKDQVYNALSWYVIKTTRYRNIEYLLNAVNLVVPAALMVCTQYMAEDDMVGQLIITILGTVAAAIKSSSKLHEKRVCYRVAAEAIKSETILYINRVDVYSSRERDSLFVKRITQIGKEENIHWVEIETNRETIEEKI